MNDNYSRILGIDYGSVRIGLSLSDPLKIIASALTTLSNNDECIQEILKIIHEQNIERIIIGNPLNLKGETGIKAEEVNAFIRRLQEQTPVEIISLDERFTSVMAQRSILSMGTKKKERRRNKGMVDAVAAAILLQGYLDARR